MRALIVLMFMALPVGAQVAPCDPNQPQSALTQCVSEAYQAWDGLLNEAYQRVIGIQDASGEERLRQAQRAWITYRDLACEMERARYDGGSIAPMIQLQCLTRLTERRTRDLEDLLRF
ncbi:lysozyme inhibitor LprI family protein [Gymnodinialimonas ulvae]|uniref:lysozyme inhibitor LprI family protein n=1 Tax=Gymnodinialimonas ulvae TaxID=3126504 RepID=UPI00309BD0D0